MSPFGEIASKEARLRDRPGCGVDIAPIGGGAPATAGPALAVGGDRGVLVPHGGPLDPVVVSRPLADGREAERPHLVIAGEPVKAGR